MQVKIEPCAWCRELPKVATWPMGNFVHGKTEGCVCRYIGCSIAKWNIQHQAGLAGRRADFDAGYRLAEHDENPVNVSCSYESFAAYLSQPTANVERDKDPMDPD